MTLSKPSHSSIYTDTEPSIKSEPVEDVDLVSTVSHPQYEHEIDKYLDFTHEDLSIARPTATTVLSSSCPIDDSDAPLLHPDQEPAGYSHVNEQLEYPCATFSSSSSPTEETPLLELAQYFYFTDQLDYPITADSNSFCVADTSPTTSSPSSFTSFSAPTASPPTPIASPRSSLFSSSFAGIAIPSSSSSELSLSNAPSINTEDVPCSTVALDEASDSVKPSAEPEVHYTFFDPHEKPKKRRTKGLKNSTPIACTFCRRRKIRCGGPQEGGVCKYVSSLLLFVSLINVVVVTLQWPCMAIGERADGITDRAFA